MSKKNLSVLVLTDGKISSLNQCEGLISILEKNKKFEFNLHFQKVSLGTIQKLPNIAIYYLMKFKVKKDYFLNINPNLIISCGRVSAPVSLIAKTIFKCLNVHILNPYISYKNFDFIIIPKHDNFPKLTNVIRINTAMVDKKKLFFSRSEILEKLEHQKIPYKKNLVTILLGGNSDSTKITKNDMKKLIKNLKVNKNKNDYYCFLFSRRSSEMMKDLVRDNFQKDSYIWNEILPNPYWLLLKVSKYLIVTGDSISMTSECIAARKCVFVFMPQNLKTKTKKFQYSLFKKNITKQYKENFLKYKLKENDILKLENVISNKIGSKLFPSFMNP